MAETKKFCTECGEPLSSRAKKCPKCGTLVPTKAKTNEVKPSATEEVIAPIEETVQEQAEVAVAVAVAEPEVETAPAEAAPTQESRPSEEKGLLEQKQVEKAVEIDPAPPRKSKYAPVSTLGFFLMYILLLIPVVNIVLLFVWARKNSKKVNRRNFARAALIFILILVIWAAVSYFFGQAIYGGLVTKYAGFLEGIGLDSLVQLWGNV